MFPPVPARRRRRPVWPVVLVVVLGLAVAVVLNAPGRTTSGQGIPSLAYRPQLLRNAEVDSPAHGVPFSDAQIDKIVRNNSYENILNFANGFAYLAPFGSDHTSSSSWRTPSGNCCASGRCE